MLPPNRISKSYFAPVGIAAAALYLMSLTGCSGMNNGLSQSLGINSGARVPAPATGSFAAPNAYSSGSQPTAQPLTPPVGTPTSSYFNPAQQPATQLLSTINNAQNQLQSATNQVRDNINRTADELNAKVASANNRVERVGQGVVQASAVLSESFQAPVGSGAASPGPTSVDYDAEIPTTNVPNASWQKPLPQ